MRSCLVTALLCLGACGDDLPPPPPADGGPRDFGAPDAGPAPTDAGLDAGPCPDAVPSGAFGIAEGDVLAPFAFDDCSGRERALYGERYCTARATVVNFGAGWCTPCFEETPLLQTELVDRYGDPVRVVQVLFDTATFEDPNSDDCRRWVDRFGTAGVETLVATGSAVDGYLVNGGGVPTTFVLDGSGRIRLAKEGSEPGLPDIRATVEAILAE